MTLRNLGCALLVHLLVASGAFAQEAWPADPETARVDITQLEMDDDLSGAAWNPVTRELWLAKGGGNVWRMSSSGDDTLATSWLIDTIGGEPAHWRLGGDAEAITLADLAEDTVYLGIENDNDSGLRAIVEFEVSTLPGVEMNRWLLAEMTSSDVHQGLEGLTFVPDEFLGDFVDQFGNPYPSSVFGTGGLFFAALKQNGTIFVFDLDRNGPNPADQSYIFVGAYRTGESGVGALEFDRSSGILYSYSNYVQFDGDDILRAMTIAPQGIGPIKLLPTVEFWFGPRQLNNEGIAIYESTDCDGPGGRLFFLATDRGGVGNSLGIYANFECTHTQRTDIFDGFESEHFGGGVGWIEPWTVTGDAIVRNTTLAHTGLHEARIQTTSAIERSFDLSTASEAHLKFWTRLKSMESSDSGFVMVSPDGVNYTTIHTFGDGDDTNEYTFHCFDLSGFALTADFRIRFEGLMSSSKDHWYLDDITITGDFLLPEAGGGPGGDPGPTNLFPVAVLTADVTSGEVPLTVNLDASGSFDPDGTITLFELDLEGDGTFDLTGVTAVEHTYDTVGNYLATVRVTDNEGDTRIAVVSIAVEAPPPPPPPAPEGQVAIDDFEAGHFSGGIGWASAWNVLGEAEIRETNSAHSGLREARIIKTAAIERTVDLSGATEACLQFWSRVDSFESDKAHVLVSPDGITYTTIKTFDNDDDTDIYTLHCLDLSGFALTANFRIRFEGEMSSSKDYWYLDDISVQADTAPEPPGPGANQFPVASLDVDITSGNAPLTATLDATASFDPDGTIEVYEWDFEGDGTYDVAGPASLVHTYDTAGSYLATVRVTDDAGATATARVPIDVSTPPAPPPPPAGGLLASDDFESGDFAGGSGWTGAWSAIGNAEVRTNQSLPTAGGSSHVRIKGGVTSMERALDLTGATGASLRFWGRVKGFENSDEGYVKVSTDGGLTYTTVYTFIEADDDDTYRFYEIDLSGFAMTADFRIRFESGMSSSRDLFYIDEVEIGGTR